MIYTESASVPTTVQLRVMRGDTHLSYVVVQPRRAPRSIDMVIVPVIVPRHVLKDIVHVLLIDIREARLDIALLSQGREVYTDQQLAQY